MKISRYRTRYDLVRVNGNLKRLRDQDQCHTDPVDGAGLTR